MKQIFFSTFIFVIILVRLFRGFAGEKGHAAVAILSRFRCNSKSIPNVSLNILMKMKEMGHIHEVSTVVMNGFGLINFTQAFISDTVIFMGKWSAWKSKNEKWKMKITFTPYPGILYTEYVPSLKVLEFRKFICAGQKFDLSTLRCSSSYFVKTYTFSQCFGPRKANQNEI